MPDSTFAGERDLESGARVGEYVIEAKIGAGTFGSVYRGIQPLIGKQVAVKVLSQKYSADPTVVSRFIAEARAVNQIRHKNIIDIFSFGQLEDGRHYHVMELLEGQPLDTYVHHAGGRLEVVELIRILRGLARALDAAHAAGIAHRDLKPANVFLARDEEGSPFPKLLDFGIAKLLADDLPRQHSTATGAAVGTPDYMSPEQCQGPDVDHRTDIYAFGVMTYQLLTGHLPHRGSNVVEVLMKQMTAEPIPPSRATPDVPPMFDAVVLQMMAKLPDDRPMNCCLAVQLLTNAALDAGYEIPSASHSGEQVALQDAAGSDASPTGAFAHTLPSTSSGALETPHPSKGPGRIALAVGFLVMVTAVAAAPLWMDAAEPSARDVTADRVSPASHPPAARTDAERVEEAEMPAPRGVVDIVIVGAPDGARVFGPGGVDFGEAAEGLRLPQGTRPLKLTIRAEGFEDLAKEIVPAASGTVGVSMTTAKARETKRARPRVKSRRRAPAALPKSKDALEIPNWD